MTKENAYIIMRGGRARWKIENETFNTLKNQGYNLKHNYGLGEKYLAPVFTMLMMLAFLVDQTQERGRNNFPNSSKKWLCLRVSFEKQSLYPKFEHYFDKNIKKCEKS